MWHWTVSRGIRREENAPGNPVMAYELVVDQVVLPEVLFGNGHWIV